MTLYWYVITSTVFDLSFGMQTLNLDDSMHCNQKQLIPHLTLFRKKIEKLLSFVNNSDNFSLVLLQTLLWYQGLSGHFSP